MYLVCDHDEALLGRARLQPCRSAPKTAFLSELTHPPFSPQGD